MPDFDTFHLDDRITVKVNDDFIWIINEWAANSPVVEFTPDEWALVVFAVARMIEERSNG